MVRIFVRRSRDVSYLVDDAAHELDEAREGAAQWWPHGDRGERSAESVLSRREPGAVVGYDIVVAAPRAMSCLLAVGSIAEQRGVVAAHRVAVAGALSYLEERAVVERRVVLGDVEERPRQWRSVASFTHGVNRAGEPHLHDHVLVGSLPLSGTRTWDGRALFVHARAADAVYRGALREGLNRTTERTAWRSFRGHEYLSGVDEGVRALWPGRANDRQPKVHWTQPEVRDRWRRDLLHYEVGPQVAPPTRSRSAFDEHAFGAALHDAGLIRRQEIVAAWADAAPFGATARDVETAINHWYPELVRERGRGSVALSRSRARMDGVVRELGERTAVVRDEPHLSRDRSVGRSREFDRWERNR